MLPLAAVIIVVMVMKTSKQELLWYTLRAEFFSGFVTHDNAEFFGFVTHEL
jgi:hypothetical protein